MTGIFINGYQRFLRKGATLILAFSWISGLLLGFGLCDIVGSYAVSLMRGCVYSPVSIVWFFAFAIFPFLLSALAVYLSFPWLILLICFGRAVLFGFVFAGLESVWENSAWLVRIGLLFEDFFLIPILYLFWHRHIFRDGRFPLGDWLATVVWIIPAVVVQIKLIQPFFAEIMIF